MIKYKMIMTEKDLLNNREAMKLALAFDKMAKEYKTTIQKIVAEGKTTGWRLYQHYQ